MLDLDEGKITPKQGSLIASAVLSAHYVNVAQRPHQGDALCSATVTISRLWHRFREQGELRKVFNMCLNRYRVVKSFCCTKYCKTRDSKSDARGLLSPHRIQADICSFVVSTKTGAHHTVLSILNTTQVKAPLSGSLRLLGQNL